MTLLKNSFILRIKNALDESVFTRDDFELTLPKSGKKLIEIAFAYDPSFTLVVSKEQRQDKVTVGDRLGLQQQTRTNSYSYYLVKTVPGEYMQEESESIDELDEVPNIIHYWCKYIKDDLYARKKTKDPLEELRKKFQDEIESNLGNPDEDFSDEEIAKINIRFDEILEEVRGLQEELSISKEQLGNISEEFQEFKRSATIYPKGIWARITSNKLVKVIGSIANSAEGRKLLFDQVRKIISNGGA